MTSSPANPPLRILLSEGSSTSARQAITILGLAGHHVEVCDPAMVCLARFSRFVRKLHRCPPLSDDSRGYLAFVEALLACGRYDVLLPIHEQGLVFARAPERLASLTGVALPSFDAYRTAHNKADFSRLLGELGIAQPATRIVSSRAELEMAIRFPCVIKSAVGTASRGVWIVRSDRDLAAAVREIEASDAADEILVQAYVEGAVEKAQAVFAHGSLIGFHACRQLAEGAGGGDARKQSVERPALRDAVARIGARLNWHGALSVDVIQRDDDDVPLFIDCNPRLVEPMSAHRAGCDLLGALLQVSLGQMPSAAAAGRVGVRTHQAMQVLLGAALHGASRRELARAIAALWRGCGVYAGSVEELTPVSVDRPSAIPLIMTAAILLAAPPLARTLAARGWGRALLSPRAIAQIEAADFGAG